MNTSNSSTNPKLAFETLAMLVSHHQPLSFCIVAPLYAAARSMKKSTALACSGISCCSFQSAVPIDQEVSPPQSSSSCRHSLPMRLPHRVPLHHLMRQPIDPVLAAFPRRIRVPTLVRRRRGILLLLLWHGRHYRHFPATLLLHPLHRHRHHWVLTPELHHLLLALALLDPGTLFLLLRTLALALLDLVDFASKERAMVSRSY